MQPGGEFVTAGYAGFTGLIGMLLCCAYFLFLALSVVMLVIWIWMLVDVLKRKDNEFGPNATKDSRLIWLLIILLTQGIGATIYYFLIYRKYPERD